MKFSERLIQSMVWLCYLVMGICVMIAVGAFVACIVFMVIAEPLWGTIAVVGMTGLFWLCWYLGGKDFFGDTYY